MRTLVRSRLADPVDRPYSQGVVGGGLIFVSGQVPTDASGAVVGTDAEAQADQVIDRIAAVLDGAGASLDDVCRLTVYLVDFADFAAVNAAVARRFAAPYPARTTVAAGLVRPELRVEIDAIAALPHTQP
ncbi:MAG: RidA family protein [Acidimicrobiia bacterium]